MVSPGEKSSWSAWCSEAELTMATRESASGFGLVKAGDSKVGQSKPAVMLFTSASDNAAPYIRSSSSPIVKRQRSKSADVA